MFFQLIVRLESRFRGGRGVPITASALVDISRRYNDVAYCNTLKAYMAGHDAVICPYRDVVASKLKKKCGKRAGVAASIMRALEAAEARPVIKDGMLLIEKSDGASITFKTSSCEIFAAYWDILRATDPLLEAILAVGTDAESAEACITELNKVAAYDTAGHVAAAKKNFRAALAAASRVFGV